MSTTERIQPQTNSELKARLEGALSILAIRESELLRSKGPCSHKGCRLHFAHSGPCNTKEQAA